MEMTSPVHRYKGPGPGVSAVEVQITVFCVLSALFVSFERYAGQVNAFGNTTDVVVGPVVGLADGGR